MSHVSSGADARLVDVGRPAIPLWQFCFLSPSGSVTLSGYFCDLHGFPMPTVTGGSTYSVTASIGATTPVTLLTLFGLTALPAMQGDLVQKACGFVGQLSGAVAFCAASADMLTVPASVSADMVANVGSYPQIAASTGLRLGRA